MMPMHDDIVKILAMTLQLGDRAKALTPESGLLGALPEFDSVAVVTVITAVEDRFDIVVDDDELTAEVFETVGSLTEFVESKVA